MWPLLILLGVGALGVGGAYLYGKHQSSVFDLEGCLTRYKKMGYSNEKAYEICKKQAEIYVQEQQSSPAAMFSALVPVVGLLGVGYLVYRIAQSGKMQQRLLYLPPQVVQSPNIPLKQKEKAVKENARQVQELSGVPSELPRIPTPHPIR